MMVNSLGLTATHFQDGAGNLLNIPYRVPAHGFILVSRDRQVIVMVLPVCASEDPRFVPWLSRRGLYRVEDPSGSVARIGEGRVLERIRRHRAAPIVLPSRLVAAFGGEREWSYSERQFLEEAWANSWVADGHTLASRIFTRRPMIETLSERASLQATLSYIRTLARLGDRILDNDADDFFEDSIPAIGRWPSPPNSPVDTSEDMLGGEVVLRQSRHSLHAASFPAGTLLTFEDGCVAAAATVRRSDVVLHPGSTVYLHTSRSVGRTFAAQHRAFLGAARAAVHGEVGITRVPVAAATAAFLIKNVTAGRAHTASRWRIG